MVPIRTCSTVQEMVQGRSAKNITSTTGWPYCHSCPCCSSPCLTPSFTRGQWTYHDLVVQSRWVQFWDVSVTVKTQLYFVMLFLSGCLSLDCVLGFQRLCVSLAASSSSCCSSSSQQCWLKYPWTPTPSSLLPWLLSGSSTVSQFGSLLWEEFISKKPQL